MAAAAALVVRGGLFCLAEEAEAVDEEEALQHPADGGPEGREPAEPVEAGPEEAVVEGVDVRVGEPRGARRVAVGRPAGIEHDVDEGLLDVVHGAEGLRRRRRRGCGG